MTILSSKKHHLAERGWRFGDASDFLGLSKSESVYIEMKLSLAELLRKRRSKLHLTQIEVAKAVSSSQSRIAKMEAADPSVSLDLLIRSLIAIGTTKTELARAISSAAGT